MESGVMKMENNTIADMPDFLNTRLGKEIIKSGDAVNQPTSEVLPSPEDEEIKTEEYQPHPYANMFPMMRDEDFNALVASISKDGLEEHIVKYEGKILDGRNRHAACIKAGVEPVSDEYEEDDPFGFVLRKNLHRRQLQTSQRAMVAAKMANLKIGQRADEVSGTSIEVAAKTLNIGKASVERAKSVLASGDEELIEAVESGEKTVSAAANEIAAPSTSAASLPEGERQSQRLFKLWNKTGDEGQVLFLEAIGATT
jgi:hypothetical protein